MKLKLSIIAAALSLAFAGAAQAQSTPSASGMDQQPKVDRKAMHADEDRIKADYKADMAKCTPMQGNEKEVCEADAKGKEMVAKAELEQRYEPSARHERNVEEAKAEHQYKVAKEKCDAQKGKEESACEKDAKAQYERAKADIKAKYASESRPASGGSAPAASPRKY